MSSEIFSVFPLPISRESSLHYVVSYSASFDVIPLFLHRSLLLYFGLRESTSSFNNLAEMSRPFDKIEFSCYLQYIANIICAFIYLSRRSFILQQVCQTGSSRNGKQGSLSPLEMPCNLGHLTLTTGILSLTPWNDGKIH